ncbi:NAD(P)-dependent oxidoreductase [Alloyangia pacifica]|uniref:NAD(P)-dependent oxidoreductase n=1 Tax=Alloyangia pacifica TaxID=311180 RepID=UPI001CFDBFA7|nr:NAD(P)-dependent oxidoreductase [Alloyangia pacifica]
MTTPIKGVFLSETLDLNAMYGRHILAQAQDVVCQGPEMVTDPLEVRYALCWKPAPGAFDAYPNLELAMSIGAGVDALLAHPGLRPEISVARVRDPEQAELMAGFAAHEVLHHERAFGVMEDAAARCDWIPVEVRRPSSASVAILGYGTMGQAIARVQSTLGYRVRVASRAPQRAPLERVTYYSGPEAVNDAAEGAKYLINVLPLTEATENVLCSGLFERLSLGGYLVQIGRGEHLVDADLLDALDGGHLAGASLDVFRQEPLPRDHAYWRHPKIRVSPHVASYSSPEVVAAQLIEAARALARGQRSEFVVDRARGY